MIRSALLPGVLSVLTLALVVPATASAAVSQESITVNTAIDAGLGENPNYCEEGEGTGRTTCPLRAALEAAARVTVIGVEEIAVVVPPGHYSLEKGELAIGNAHDDSCRPGKEEFTCPVRLQGAGASRTFIEAAPSSSVLVAETGPVTIAGATVEGGRSSNYGGGLFGEAAVTLREDVFTDDSADKDGGGVFVENGTLNVLDTSINGNAAFAGGAIATHDVQLAVSRSTLDENEAVDGGAVLAERQSTPAITITDSTISANEASSTGGGILLGSEGALHLAYSTIAANTAATGSSIAVFFAGDTLSAEGSIIDGEAACVTGSTATAGGPNILFPAGGCSFAGTPPTTANPLLGALSANGGVGETMPLLRGSPAVNAGGSSCAASAVEGADVDERGQPRPRGAACDLGAYEAGGDAGITLSGSASSTVAGASLEVTADASDAGTDPLGGVEASISLPAGVVLLAVPSGCSATAGLTTTVLCRLGTIAPSQHIPITITARAELPGSLLASATVQAEQADFNPANNSAATAILINPAPAPPAGAAQTPPASSGTALVGRSLPLSHGRLLLKLTCAAGTPGGCHDAFALYSGSGRLPALAGSKHSHRRATLLAKGHAFIPAGETRVVHLTLDAAGLRLMRHHRPFWARLVLSLRTSARTTTHRYSILAG